MYLSRLASLFILFIITAAQNPRSSLPSFTKRVEFVNRDFVHTYSIDAEGIHFAHAACRRRNEYENYKSISRLHKKCRLVLEPMTTLTQDHTCEVKLYPKWSGGTVARQFKLVRFGSEHLVFVWRENIDTNPTAKRRYRRYIPYPMNFTYRKDHLRVKVINMRSCKTRDSQELLIVSDQREKIYDPKICTNAEECEKAKNETEIFAEDEGKINNVNIVVNGDESFDLYYRNAFVCGKERRCKVTYDIENERFSFVTVAPLEVKYDAVVEIHPIISARGSSKILAYAVQSLRLDDGAITLLNSLGQSIYEHSYSWSVYNLLKGISHIAMSTDEEALGFCQQPVAEPVIQCSLFDAKGRGLIGVDVALKSADVALIEMRNTFDAGFLLLIGYGNSTTKNGLEALDILRVDSRGDLASVHTAKNHKCARDESGVDVGLVEKGASQVCFYMLCTWPMPKVNGEETNWQIFGECFSGKE